MTLAHARPQTRDGALRCALNAALWSYDILRQRKPILFPYRRGCVANAASRTRENITRSSRAELCLYIGRFQLCRHGCCQSQISCAGDGDRQRIYVVLKLAHVSGSSNHVMFWERVLFSCISVMIGSEAII